MTEKDCFRDSFKYYKQRNAPDYFLRVIDVNADPLNDRLTLQSVLSKSTDDCIICKDLGLLSHGNWNVYVLKDLDGVFLLRNPFTVDGQSKWIQKCLHLYPLQPSITNLHLLNPDIRCDDVAPYVDKLSWATLGYHYNWETKEYDSSTFTPLPSCLSSLSQHLAHCLGFDEFMPDAAIVNYYHRKSTLGIHNDCSEEALDQPLISLSFGQSAIFLVGTSRKTDCPLPLLLRSGDVVVLSGKSRLSHHAVPAIILNPPSENCGLLGLAELDESIRRYIQAHRINISVRQVYKKNSSMLQHS